MIHNDTGQPLTKASVPRDEMGRKMYPGRYWAWPKDLPPIDTYDGQMQYGIALWTNTNETMPTVRQLAYVMWLLQTRELEEAYRVPEESWSSKAKMGQLINWLVKLPSSTSIGLAAAEAFKP